MRRELVRRRRVRAVLVRRRARGAAAALQVLAQQRHARERLAAARARVLLHVRVRLQVSAKVRPVGESAATVMAREWLFARVGANVALQQPGPRESLPAQVAFARQRVRPDVHLERTERSVHLGAILAAERFSGETPFGGRAVVLLMFGQSGVSGI